MMKPFEGPVVTPALPYTPDVSTVCDGWWVWSALLDLTTPLMPATFVVNQDSSCKRKDVRRDCQAPAGGGPLEEQILFSVYVHSRPDYGAWWLVMAAAQELAMH